MPEFLKNCVRGVEKISRLVGCVAIYLIFVLMAALLYSSIFKAFLLPAHWTLEMTQFPMGALHGTDQDHHVTGYPAYAVPGDGGDVA